MRLENWEVEDIGEGKQWIVGNVYGHPNHADGKIVHTSRLVELNLEDKVAKTLNSIYQLGEPKK